MSGGRSVTRIRPAAVPDPVDPMIAARLAQAHATAELAKAINKATLRLGPAADTVHGFAERLDGLCLFMKKKGPWLLASIPLVLTTMGAITPNMAAALSKLLADLAHLH